MNDRALSMDVAADHPALRVVEALAFSVLIGAAGQLRIPLWFTPVPITAQTFAVVAAGSVLGARYGALAVLFYLAEGVLGMPFFAGGASGGAALFAPSAGYLLGFLPAAALSGELARRGWDRSPAGAAASAALASLVVFACGLPVLARFVPPGRLLLAGFWPFVPGDLVKIALAAGLLPAWRGVAGSPGRR